MTTEHKLPERKPDLYFPVTSGHKFPVWNESNHFVVTLNLKDGNQIVYAKQGKFDLNNFLVREEIVYAILAKILDYIKQDA